MPKCTYASPLTLFLKEVLKSKTKQKPSIKMFLVSLLHLSSAVVTPMKSRISELLFDFRKYLILTFNSELRTIINAEV